MHELLAAVREGVRSVAFFVAGLGASVALNLLGAFAAPVGLRVPLFVAGAVAALLAVVGYLDALLAAHRLRVRLSSAEINISAVSLANSQAFVRIEELEEEAATPTWLKIQRDEEAVVSAMLAPSAPLGPKSTPHPL